MDANNELLQAIGRMMDDKLSVALEPINSRLDGMDKRFDSIEESLQVVRTSQMRVELEQFPRITAAIDGVVGGNEKNKEQDSRISILESKAENQGNRILALEYAFKTK